MKKLAVMICAGHGYSTPGKRSPDGMREYEFNRRVAEVMKAELEKYEGVTVYFAHDDSRDVPLKERTDKANKLGVDVYVSIHANAFNGKMGSHGGIDTFIYKTSPKEAKALADVIQRNLISATGLRNRGVKTADFHVLRETHMTAVLIEHGFMDSTTDLPKLKSDAYRKLCGETNAKSLAQFYGLKRKPAPAPAPKKDVFYRVVTGSFNDKENAERRVAELKKAGFDSFLMAYKKEDAK
ncbi:N-acetylmuramoyl-L-alanine amidase [Bacillus sp. ISL-37]|uniref:N-acetylmuramoyl-L-alanine amidase n=1 Tax=Bacillus sp. ISL-37 TaxID=2819123 RepID=UPI001BE569BC|nr:N-acetylmuramoyl-L-alanine amidase [Bacillus sp. ISL-37]MBT2682668.1 N-acetylmuramoyl-L-alanine amidase [Bacillus sp. ISL-37]